VNHFVAPTITASRLNVDANLKELYRRVAFNISVGNSDDHFRNHGFLLTARGWTLSPAYDMNPTVHAYQSLLIDRHSNKADLQLLLEACEDYMLDKTTATQIIAEVVAAVKGWQPLATWLGITRSEMDIFGYDFVDSIRARCNALAGSRVDVEKCPRESVLHCTGRGRKGRLITIKKNFEKLFFRNFEGTENL
jgi:hypothetical protein